MTTQSQQITIRVEELLQALKPLFHGPDVSLYESLRDFFNRQAQETVALSLPIEPELPSPVDALAEIAAMSQPLGPADLARKFDIYTQRTVSS